MDTINQRVLMSDTQHFSVVEINPYSHNDNQPNIAAATAEHTAIAAALHTAGVEVVRVPIPAHCQDGVYTANWALCLDGRAYLSQLPPFRQQEESVAETALRQLGLQTIRAPYRFSGQGDALPVGPYLLCGSHYRTDPRVHPWLAEKTNLQVVSLQTVPLRDQAGQPVINHLTGWPDSLFYDIDLAIAVLHPSLIAWCPAAFDAQSQAKIRQLKLELIEVELDEAINGFACNLISTGNIAIMSDKAPKLQAAIEEYGLRTITPPVTELAKGGGYIRCTTLTLSH